MGSYLYSLFSSIVTGILYKTVTLSHILKFKRSFPFWLNKTYSIIGILNPSIICSILYIINSSVSLILYLLLNKSSHPPKSIEDKLFLPFWFFKEVIWWTALSSSIITSLLFLRISSYNSFKLLFNISSTIFVLNFSFFVTFSLFILHIPLNISLTLHFEIHLPVLRSS